MILTFKIKKGRMPPAAREAQRTVEVIRMRLGMLAAMAALAVGSTAPAARAADIVLTSGGTTTDRW